MSVELLRIAEGMKRLGIRSRSTYYEGVKNKVLPAPVSLYPGSKSKRIPSSDIDAHIARQIAARDKS
jgi:predicted DNA-binding transcriptional regulator AlpA